MEEEQLLKERLPEAFEIFFQPLPGVYLLLNKNFKIKEASNNSLNDKQSHPENSLYREVYINLSNNNQKKFPWFSALQKAKETKKPQFLLEQNATSLSIEENILLLYSHPFCMPIMDNNNELQYLLIIFKVDLYNTLLDIVHLKVKNKKLQEISDDLRKSRTEKAKLASIIESTIDAIFTRSLDGSIQTWNKGSEDLYGYTADEIIGKNVACLIPDTFHARFQNNLRKVNSGKVIRPLHTELLHKDGLQD